MLAHSPWLLEGELAKMRLKKVFDYILSPRYQELAPELGLVRTAKGAFPKGNGVKLYGLEHYQKHGQMDELLMHLELFARLGLINRYPLLMSHLEWLQSQQGKDGRWNLSTKLINDASRWTTLLRIEKDWRSPARKEADLTPSSVDLGLRCRQSLQGLTGRAITRLQLGGFISARPEGPSGIARTAVEATADGDSILPCRWLGGAVWAIPPGPDWPRHHAHNSLDSSQRAQRARPGSPAPLLKRPLMEIRSSLVGGFGARCGQSLQGLTGGARSRRTTRCCFVWGASYAWSSMLLCRHLSAPSLPLPSDPVPHLCCSQPLLALLS